MRYQCIEKQKKAWPINLMCDVLEVSRRGYDDWLARDLSQQDRSNQELARRIQTIFAEHQQRYGAPRIARTLSQEGHLCSENHVARRMRVLHLRAIQAKKFKITTDSHHLRPVALDLLKQDFDARTLNQKWTADITYVWTDEGGAVSGCGAGPVLTSLCGVVDEPMDDATTGVWHPHHGLVPPTLIQGHDPSF